MKKHEFLKVSEVAKLCRLSESTIHRLERENLFPQKIRIAKRAVVWAKEDLIYWLEQQKKPYLENEMSSVS